MDLAKTLAKARRPAFPETRAQIPLTRSMTLTNRRPKSESLLKLVKSELVNKPNPLAAGEFRVLRQASHPRAKDFAAAIDVTPEIVSKWENGKGPIPSPVDRLVRLLVAVRWGLTADPAAWLALGTDAAPLERRFVLGARGWRLDAKAKREADLRASRQTA